jgi:AraC-like DNA-binding protein
MTVQSYSPGPALRPFVRALLVIDSPAPVTNEVLPDTALVLVLRLRGSVRAGAGPVLPAAVLSGLRPGRQPLHYAAGTTTLLVQFAPGGAAACFAQPLHELFGRSAPLDALLPWRELALLEEQLAEAPDRPRQLALVERWLLGRLRPAAVPPRVRQALHAIGQQQGQLRIAALAAALPSSRDAFEKQFRRAVGTSPKQFAGLVRFRQVLRLPRPSLTALAHAAGYFDQAHFIRDFRAFTGQAPRQFFAAGQYW